MSVNPIPPASMLQYQTPPSGRRPGMLTSVGIMSIIVAALSGLSSLMGVFTNVGLYVASQVNAVTTTTTVTTTGATTTTTVVTSGGVTTAPTTAAVMVNPLRIDALTLLFSGGTELLSLLAAVVLMIAGIQLLRDSPSARRLHWLFVNIKLPLVILAAVAQWMLYSSMMSSVTATTPGGTAAVPGMAKWIMLIPSLFGLVFSLAYPVALIIVLPSRTARQYFEAVKPTYNPPIGERKIFQADDR